MVESKQQIRVAQPVNGDGKTHVGKYPADDAPDNGRFRQPKNQDLTGF
jgi:hypothetical protein